MHQHPLADREPALREQRVVRGREDLGEPAGLGPRQAGGHGQRDPLVDERPIGLGAAPHDGHHAIAGAEAAARDPRDEDDPGELHPGDVLGEARRRGVEALALEQIGRVHARGPHLDEQLVVAGHRVGVLTPAQGAIGHGHGVHEALTLGRSPRGGTVPAVADDGLVILDEDGEELHLDAEEAATLLALTHDFEAATVSACPSCRSRVLACVALVDLLGDAPPHPRTPELVELAEDAPTLHLYVHDVVTTCSHRMWRDPGSVEWSEVLEEFADARRGLR